MTSNTFGVAVPTVTVTIRTVCYAITEHLLPKYIHKPQDEPSLRDKLQVGSRRLGFQWLLVQLMEPTSPSCNHTATHKIIVLTK